MQTHIHQNVADNSIVVSDESRVYHSLSQRVYNHKSVNRSQGQYVKSTTFENRVDGRIAFKIYTNTVEGLWSLVKKTINGTHHWVSQKHLQKYLNEMIFRYKNRALDGYNRFILLTSNISQRLKYKQLTA